MDWVEFCIIKFVSFLQEFIMYSSQKIKSENTPQKVENVAYCSDVMNSKAGIRLNFCTFFGLQAAIKLSALKSSGICCFFSLIQIINFVILYTEFDKTTKYL